MADTHLRPVTHAEVGAPLGAPIEDRMKPTIEILDALVERGWSIAIGRGFIQFYVPDGIGGKSHYAHGLGDELPEPVETWIRENVVPEGADAQRYFAELAKLRDRLGI